MSVRYFGNSARGGRFGRQSGLTLVELLVAIVLMLMVTLATVALYNVNSSGKRTVDSSQGMDDTARFVFELVGQALHNAGFANPVRIEDAGGTYSNLFDTCATSANTEPCPILGFDNSKVAGSNYGAAGSGDVNASDALAVRFYGASQKNAAGNWVPDGSVQTCGGRPVGASGSMGELGLSIFWVQIYQDEPELYCTDNPGLKPDGSSASRETAPIARGVETFQVMYGVDVCTGGPPCTYDGIPNRWVNAGDMAAGDWGHVSAVRVGLVLRGAPGSSQASDGNDLYPLGKDFVGAYTGGGLKFTPPTDSRLRRVYTSTFLLRNPPV